MKPYIMATLVCMLAWTIISCMYGLVMAPLSHNIEGGLPFVYPDHMLDENGDLLHPHTEKR